MRCAGGGSRCDCWRRQSVTGSSSSICSQGGLRSGRGRRQQFRGRPPTRSDRTIDPYPTFAGTPLPADAGEHVAVDAPMIRAARRHSDEVRLCHRTVGLEPDVGGRHVVPEPNPTQRGATTAGSRQQMGDLMSPRCVGTRDVVDDEPGVGMEQLEDGLDVSGVDGCRKAAQHPVDQDLGDKTAGPARRATDLIPAVASLAVRDRDHRNTRVRTMCIERID